MLIREQYNFRILSIFFLALVIAEDKVFVIITIRING